MHERKAKMYKLSDAFIALPGGLGTLEELLEIFTWKHLGYHEKSVAILNTLGYYDGLLAFMEKAVESGFLKRKHMESLIVSEDPQQLLALVREHEHQSVDKWDN
jgi:hypothetical protein